MNHDAEVGVNALVGAALAGHPEEVAREIDRASLAEAVALVSDRPSSAAWGRVFEELSSERATRLLETLSTETSGGIIEQLEPPLAAVLLGRLSEATRERLLRKVRRPLSDEIRELLSFGPDSAGGIMDPRVLAFRAEARVAEVLDRLRETPWKGIVEVFVIESQGRLVGTVPLQEVAVASPETTLGNLMRPPRAVLQPTATQEEVVELLDERKIPAVPVVDLDGRLLGVIRYDALITAAREEVSADIQTMVGASKEERALSRVSFAVRKRLPWLQINLGTAFLAASVVGIFENTIARFTALAVLLPVVAGQSGNTGAQALAVTMRGLALREIRVRQWARVLLKEVRVGVVNGVAVAATTSFFVFLWSRSVGLAMVIGFSMVISMAIAGLSGGAIPLVLTSLGQDPAQSSSIILTTVTDVVGFFSFLGIATLLAGML